MDALIAILESDGSLRRNDPGVRPLYSISKTFIAAAVVQLGIDLERPVSDWIGAETLSRGAEIQVRHLLTHSAGLRDYGSLPAYQQAIAAREPPWSDDTFARCTLHPPLLFEPGQGFAYSNPGYWLLKRILELETGDGFSDVMQRLILAPLSLDATFVATGQFAEDLPAYPAEWVWHGLLMSSAGETARFLASALIEPLRALSVAVPGQSEPWQRPHYGLGLMIEPGQHFGHNGGGPGYSAACYRFEQTGRVVSVLMRGGRDEGAMFEALRIGAGGEH